MPLASARANASWRALRNTGIAFSDVLKRERAPVSRAPCVQFSTVVDSGRLDFQVNPLVYLPVFPERHANAPCLLRGGGLGIRGGGRWHYSGTQPNEGCAHRWPGCGA